RAEAGRGPGPSSHPPHHARQGRHLPGHLHRALRPRPRDDADDGGRDDPGGLRQVAQRPVEGGRLAESGDGRQSRLHEQRLRRVPHVRRRRDDGEDRPRPRQAGLVCAAGAPAAPGVRADVDRQPERLHPARVSEGRHAPDFRNLALEAATRRTGHVSRGRQEVTAMTVEHHEMTPRTGGRWSLLYRAGLIRGALGFCLLGAFGFGLVVVFRWWGGWHPLLDMQVITLVSLLVAAPVGFLAGIGAFDYWVYYALGFPTRPEDHSGHGARTWRDYFRVNTDHKVIGVQYLTTTIFFFIAGGFLAMLVRVQLARPDAHFFDPQTYNGLFSVHASLMIFLFVIPAFAGLANFVVPLMLGAPDMAFPRLNALSFWLLPIAGIMMLVSFVVPGGAFACGWTGYAPLCSTHQPLGAIFFNQGVQWAGASSIMTALNFLVTIITMRA